VVAIAGVIVALSAGVSCVHVSGRAQPYRGTRMEHRHRIFDTARVETLPNGLTLILKHNPALPIASIQVWVGVGSINESERNNGVSHFLEHLVFKGTRRFDVRAISERIERHGAVLNAGTSRDYTMYYSDIPTAGLVDALEVLYELVAEAVFPEDEMERERNVVVEEIKRRDDSPGDVLFDIFNEMLFVETPYRFRILGSEDVIRTISRNEIMAYYRTWYQPGNMTVCVAGDFDEVSLRAHILRTFGTMRPVDAPPPLPSLCEPSRPDATRIQQANVQQTYFLCGFLGPHPDDPLQYAGDVLSLALGEGISSRLYRRLRERERLVYEIDTGYYTHRGNSFFYISGVCDRENLDRAVGVMREELAAIAVSGIAPEELERAREMMQTRWSFSNETNHAQASNLAWWKMFRTIEELSRYPENIRAVTVEDVREFARRYGGSLVVAALEPSIPAAP